MLRVVQAHRRGDAPPDQVLVNAGRVDITNPNALDPRNAQFGSRRQQLVTHRGAHAGTELLAGCPAQRSWQFGDDPQDFVEVLR